MQDTRETYGSVSKTLHWLTALFFLIALPFGILAGQIGTGNPDPELREIREGYLFWHKSFAVVALALALPRLAWRLTQITPRLPDFMATWEKGIAKLVHVLLYVVLIGAPVTGLLLTQSAGHTFSVFGLFEFPTIFSFDPDIPPRERWGVRAGAFLHKVVFQYAVYAVVLLHLAGVLKHVTLDRHPEAFRRMWFSRDNSQGKQT